MKKLTTIAALAASCFSAQAQTLNVYADGVKYTYPAAAVGDIGLSVGEVAILGRRFPVSGIDSITVGSESAKENTVSVSYLGDKAAVEADGRIAEHLNISVAGAHVSVTARPTLASVVTYSLTGTTSDGSFYMDGEYDSVLQLNGLNVNNPDSGAVTIDNGKLISLQIEGANHLSDAKGGLQKACLFVNGHVHLSGGGTLSITGNSKHAYFSDEYTHMIGGTLTVNAAVSDGMHINQYFRMDGGKITINSTGDGIDVGLTGKNKEMEGRFIMNGGEIVATAKGDGAKAVKSDADMEISGGSLTAKAVGNAYYDALAADITSPAAMKCDGAFSMTNGSVSLLCTGLGGKALNVKGSVAVGGGDLSAVTTGGRYKYDSSLDAKTHAVKADNTITLSGGRVLAAVTDEKATSLKTDYHVNVDGCTLMCIGGKQTAPTTGKQAYKAYGGVGVAAGAVVGRNGVSFKVPVEYSVGNAFLLVSSPTM